MVGMIGGRQTDQGRKEHTRMNLAQMDVAAVWCGMAGLVAARFLVPKGIDVIDSEKVPVPGERTAIQKSGGFLFTRAPHTGRAASRAFEELGFSYGDGNPKATLAPESRGLRAFLARGRGEGPSRRAGVA